MAAWQKRLTSKEIPGYFSMSAHAVANLGPLDNSEGLSAPGGGVG